MNRINALLDRWVKAEFAWLDRLFSRGEAAMERLERRWSR